MKLNEPKIMLKPHQEKAILELKNGAILCAGVGLGKSITAIAYYYISVCHGVLWKNGALGPMLDPKPLYIITTAKKRDSRDWENELSRFGLPEDGGPAIVIDSWNNLNKYSSASGVFFIFDEQRVVGRRKKGSWVDHFIKATRQNEWILLTATPGDTWEDYIPVFIANGFYRNHTEFYNRHAICNPNNVKFRQIIGWRETGYLDFLRRKITVLMKCERHTERHFMDIKFAYDKALYDKIAKERWDPWKNEPIEDISGCCQLLRKAVSSKPISGMANHKNFTVNERAWTILHMCCEKHPKIIVFYNYNYELEAMRSAMDRFNELNLYSGTKPISLAEWNGHKHESIPDSTRWIYLVQYSSGAEGWNCTETDTIVFYSMNYSYKVMEQACGRIDRMNTPFNDLNYYVMKSDAPIDKAVEKALKGKKSFNEAIWWSRRGMYDACR